MRKFLFATTLFLLTSNVIAQNFKTPVEYLEYISKEQNAISKNMWKYTKTIAHSKSARKIDATRKNLVKTIQNAKNNTLFFDFLGNDVLRKNAPLTFFKKFITEEDSLNRYKFDLPELN